MQIPKGAPHAVASIRGSEAAPELQGLVHFYQLPCHVIVKAQIQGLPKASKTGFFAFHIHSGDSCAGEGFPDTMGHYDPLGAPHPEHAGDLPPLLSCGGRACMSVMTDRFRLCDVIGRTVVIHSGADDFKTQPAGDPGSKIGCGVICLR